MAMKIQRKILRSGDSKVVALPPNWCRFFNLSVGDTVEVYYGSVIFIVCKDTKLCEDLLIKELKLIRNMETEGGQKFD